MSQKNRLTIDCPRCLFTGPLTCPGCGAHEGLLQPSEVQTVSFNDLPKYLELRESGVSKQPAEARTIKERLHKARLQWALKRAIEIARLQNLDEADISELNRLSELASSSDARLTDSEEGEAVGSALDRLPAPPLRRDRTPQ